MIINTAIISVEQWYDEFGQRFEQEGYMPNLEAEQEYGVLLADHIDLCKSFKSYRVDRVPEKVAEIYGVTSTDSDQYFKEVIAGKTFADLYCGISSVAMRARAEYGASDVLAIDANHISLGYQRQAHGVPAKRLDLGEPLPDDFDTVVDVTFATYGLPYWAATASEARQSISNQAVMTAKAMFNGPIIETRYQEGKDPLINWDRLTDIEKYHLFIGFSAIDTALSLRGQGFNVSFPACIGLTEGSGSHALFASKEL